MGKFCCVWYQYLSRFLIQWHFDGFPLGKWGVFLKPPQKTTEKAWKGCAATCGGAKLLPPTKRLISCATLLNCSCVHFPHNCHWFGFHRAFVLIFIYCFYYDYCSNCCCRWHFCGFFNAHKVGNVRSHHVVTWSVST